MLNMQTVMLFVNVNDVLEEQNFTEGFSCIQG